MTTKHTPGPWSISPFGNVWAVNAGHLVLAKMDSKAPCAEQSANAHLIAAAPELLAACARALPWLGKLIADGGHMHSVAPNDAIGAMQQLEAAVNKAKGGAS